MKTNLFQAILGFFLLSINPAILNAQTPTQPGVKISGEVSTPFVLHTSDMSQYKRTDVVRKDRDGKDHTYSGVTIFSLLYKAGVTLGKHLRGENLTKYVLVEASDGYQVIFALAELDPEFTERAIILADRMDNIALPAADGPFRIIVQEEKKPARCIKQVTSIRIVFAK